MSLNAALGIASRSLEIFTAGIQVAGQNIANANTPGYIREKLILDPAQPYQRGGQIYGTGVYATGIVQQIDLFLETRIHTANADLSASEARETIYLQLEEQIRELGEEDLSTSLNNFLATINDLVNQPESTSTRQLAIQQGTQLANDISSLRLRIDELRKSQTVKVDQLVDEANSLIRQIDDLNPKISKMESSGLGGSDAGALRTLRYKALSRLSEIVPITFREREDGGVDVFTGSDFLILTGSIQQLETYKSDNRDVLVQNVRLSKTGSELSVASGGELKGIVDGRDQILGKFVDDLDAFAGSIINAFNTIYASGQGLDGFTTLSAVAQVDDPTAELDTIGLGLTPVNGTFEIKVKNKVSGTTVTTTIPVDLDGIGTDTSLNTLRAAIDAVGNISASISNNGTLRIDADPNFEFSFANDNSNILAGLGLNTFFTGRDSGNIGINQVVAGNPRLFAASLGGGPSDGRNAVKLAQFADQALSALGNVSIDDFYDTMVSQVGQKASAETAISESFKSFRESLENQRQQFSGVSIDEEAVKVLEFQRAFQASARIVSTVDELFRVLLEM
ncbi:MAG: flagellar hook-associated protein FlgK [Planctomycetaceae bacterium]